LIHSNRNKQSNTQANTQGWGVEDKVFTKQGEEKDREAKNSPDQEIANKKNEQIEICYGILVC